MCYRSFDLIHEGAHHHNALWLGAMNDQILFDLTTI